MAKVESKTKPTKASVDAFIKSFVPDEKKRKDAYEVLDMMKKATKLEPKMWGPSIIGFGSVEYESTSCKGIMPMIGFSPRKSAISLYLPGGAMGNRAKLEKLGKHKTGASCIYINKLDDVDRKVLKEMINESYKDAVKSGKWTC
jgi:hypothetical protein